MVVIEDKAGNEKHFFFFFFLRFKRASQSVRLYPLPFHSPSGNIKVVRK